MKNNLLLLICFFSVITLLKANPMVTPSIVISELYFDNNDDWFIEIGLSDKFSKNLYDSLFIRTLNEVSSIKLDSIKEGTEVFVLKSSLLNNKLSLERTGNKIIIVAYISVDPHVITDSLSFGNVPNSSIPDLPKGYSICRISTNEFARDKTPTIGLPNDTSGVYGIMEGFLYDKNNNLISSGNFELDILNKLSFRNDGSFSTKILSRKKTFNEITSFFIEGQGIRSITSEMRSIELDLAPDSIFHSNIYLLTDYLVGVKQHYTDKEYEIKIINYPNPFNSSTNFAINIPFKYSKKNKVINIYNVQGKKITTIKFQNKSVISWNGRDHQRKSVSSGIYYYELVIDNKPIKMGSMILLK